MLSFGCNSIKYNDHSGSRLTEILATCEKLIFKANKIEKCLWLNFKTQNFCWVEKGKLLTNYVAAPQNKVAASKVQQTF